MTGSGYGDEVSEAASGGFDEYGEEI